MQSYPESTYIANKMRGRIRYNFDWFDRAVKFLTSLGVDAISPADLDRAEGISEYINEFDTNMLEHAVIRDVNAIVRTEAVSLGPDWQDSLGATAEFAVARWLGHDTWYVDPDRELYVPYNEWEDMTLGGG